MEELLQKLLDADVLNEDTKKELEQAFNTQLEESVNAAKEEAAANVRAELTEQWIEERDALIEAIDTKVGEFIQSEMQELREDIERFRDLEAEYAEQLVEAKQEMSGQLKNDLAELVEKIDKFLEMRLNAEIEELREDIEEQKKNTFGRRIFEAFANEFLEEYADEESAEGNLREMQERLEDTERQLQEAERERARLERERKLNEVLSPLSGRQREVMEAILKNVDTENLEEGYKTFIGRVIRETSDDDASEQEDGVLAEDTSGGRESKRNNKKGVYTTGDEDVIEESNQEKVSGGNSQQRKHDLDYLRKIAGIN